MFHSCPADIVGLYPNFLRQAGLKSLNEALEREILKNILRRSGQTLQINGLWSLEKYINCHKINMKGYLLKGLP